MGEGVGAVLLKPLSKAVEDGNHIYGIIKSSASNHGGKTNGFAVPSLNAQVNLIEKVIKSANIPAETISYIESAANGSVLGDMIEVNALNKVFKNVTNRKNTVPIGTVKANIGHLEAASGISQLTKVLLQIKHKSLVPTISARPINPHIELENSPLYISDREEEWKVTNGVPRRALINSFGAGGSNTALIVEEYVDGHVMKKEQIVNRHYYLYFLLKIMSN
ncbi:polyketide synthase [Bacillus cereus]